MRWPVPQASEFCSWYSHSGRAGAKSIFASVCDHALLLVATNSTDPQDHTALRTVLFDPMGVTPRKASAGRSPGIRPVTQSPVVLTRPRGAGAWLKLAIQPHVHAALLPLRRLVECQAGGNRQYVCQRIAQVNPDAADDA